nr:reverse transcriptase domain-containing protein [Syntrophaceticus schinkii]
MPERKASGVDGVSKAEYEESLEANVKDLVARMKRQAYKPQAVRRVYIPKPGSNKMRPLGIPAYEDKLVQVTMARILNAIYEQDFLGCSYGFRPGRGCHDALKALNAIIENRPINYIVDADIKGFFDNVDHKWMMECLKLRIRQTQTSLRLIARFLKAGIRRGRSKLRYTRRDTARGSSVTDTGKCLPALRTGRVVLQHSAEALQRRSPHGQICR